MSYTSVLADAPSRREALVDEIELSTAPLPSWVRAPLAVRGNYGSVNRSASCAEHPRFHAHGTRAHVLHHAEEHVRVDHAGQAPAPSYADPWQDGVVWSAESNWLGSSAPGPDVFWAQDVADAAAQATRAA